MTSATARLQVRGLVVERGRKRVVDGLDLSLGAQQLIHLRGANGSGKTTVLRTIAGLIPPVRGSISWDGAVVDDYGEFRRELNYIGHLPALSAQLSGRENLEFAARIRAQPGRNTISQALRAVQATKFADRYTKSLSAGQRQRLALARLCLFDCPLWMLDEPFTALDALGRGLLEGLLDEHLDQGGMVIIATHQGFNTRHPQIPVSLTG